jgi:glycosyltransferase involved in cell wall biosynthesis
MIRILSIMEAAFVTGPAKNLIELARRSRPEIEFTIATYERTANSPNPFVDAARAAGLPVNLIFEKGRFDSSVVAQIRDLVQQLKPDIVQTHNVKSAFLMRYSGLAQATRWIAFQHGYTSTDFKMLCYNQLDRWSLRAAQRVVTVCQPFADTLVRRGVARERIWVQHNSVTRPAPPSDEEIRRVRSALAMPDSAILMVSIGRLSKEKGHTDLIRALASLRSSRPFHLVIVGEGPEREPIQAEIAGHNLTGQVTLAGLQKDVRPYYALSDIVVLPSHSEGSPNVLLEAMIHSRPVVATRVGGVPEIAQDQTTALLVPARDPAAMAQAIQRLIDDPELRQRLATAASEHAEQNFSPESYRRSMAELYRSVAGGA